jgi:hypothetical protein
MRVRRSGRLETHGERRPDLVAGVTREATLLYTHLLPAQWRKPTLLYTKSSSLNLAP